MKKSFSVKVIIIKKIDDKKNIGLTFKVFNKY
jgi:hypothetical protein